MNFFKLLFSSFARALKSFLIEVFNSATQLVIAQLKDVAINAVTELASTNMSNEMKRKEAIDRIKNYAKMKGIEVKDSLINMLIEMAVVRIKNRG